MFEHVRDSLLNYVDVDPATITPESNIVRDLGMTSFDLVTLISEFEEMYNIEIPEEKFPELQTVGAIAQYLSDNT